MPTLTATLSPTDPLNVIAVSGSGFASAQTRLLLDGVNISSFRVGSSGSFSSSITVSVSGTQTLVAQQKSNCNWIDKASTTITQSVPVDPPGGGYYISPSGNDSTGAGTLASPWATINKFYTAAAAPGDTLYCRGGTYPTNTTLLRIQNKSGSSGSPITVRNYPGETPVFPTSGIHGFMVFENGVHHWTIDGLRLPLYQVGSSGVFYVGDPTLPTHHITIRNCYASLVHEVGSFNHCVYLSYNAEDCTVENNIFVGANDGDGGTAVQAEYHGLGVRRFLIQHNIMYGFDGAGAIWINAGGASEGNGSGQVIHNTFYTNNFIHIRIVSYADLTIRDNAGVTATSQNTEDGYDDHTGNLTMHHNFWAQTFDANYYLTAGQSGLKAATDGTDAGALNS